MSPGRAETQLHKCTLSVVANMYTHLHVDTASQSTPPKRRRKQLPRVTRWICTDASCSARIGYTSKPSLFGRNCAMK